MEKDKMIVAAQLLSSFSDVVSRWTCEDIPSHIKRISDKHPEWCLEFHEWNGDPEEVESGETINQLPSIATLISNNLFAEAGIPNVER